MVRLGAESPKGYYLLRQATAAFKTTSRGEIMHSLSLYVSSKSLFQQAIEFIAYTHSRGVMKSSLRPEKHLVHASTPTR